MNKLENKNDSGVLTLTDKKKKYTPAVKIQSHLSKWLETIINIPTK